MRSCRYAGRRSTPLYLWVQTSLSNLTIIAVLEALTVLFLIAGYLTILFSDDDDSVIAVPLSLFKDVNNNCHLVLDGQYQQEAGGRLSSQLTTACQCVLAATVFDGISAYLSPRHESYSGYYG